jgi:hypothetical protein
MKHVQWKVQSGSISQVATGSGDTYQVHTEKDTVEHLIMENNAAQFWLTAEDTLPIQEPLLSDLRYLANTTAAQQILDGTYICLPEVEDVTREFLLCLQRPLWLVLWITLTHPSQGKISGLLEKAQECTSSSISDLHFGWPQRKRGYPKCMLFPLTFFINSGHSPKRWQKGLTVML